MRFVRGVAAAAALVIGGLASSAYADIEFLGTAEGGSWFGGWAIDMTDQAVWNGQTFDRIEVTINNGDAHSFTLAGQTHTVAANSTSAQFQDVGGVYSSNYAETVDSFGNTIDFNRAAWHQDGTGTATFARATGDTTNYLQFWLHLTGDSTNGVAWVVNVFKDGAIVAAGSAAYDATGNPSTTTDFRELHAVPLPPAVWSGLALMGGLGGMVAKRRRRSRVALS